MKRFMPIDKQLLDIDIDLAYAEATKDRLMMLRLLARRNKLLKIKRQLNKN